MALPNKCAIMQTFVVLLLKVPFHVVHQANVYSMLTWFLFPWWLTKHRHWHTSGPIADGGISTMNMSGQRMLRWSDPRNSPPLADFIINLKPQGTLCYQEGIENGDCSDKSYLFIIRDWFNRLGSHGLYMSKQSTYPMHIPVLQSSWVDAFLMKDLIYSSKLLTSEGGGTRVCLRVDFFPGLQTHTVLNGPSLDGFECARERGCVCVCGGGGQQTELKNSKLSENKQ